jgi:hypothetical protein
VRAPQSEQDGVPGGAGAGDRGGVALIIAFARSEIFRAARRRQLVSFTPPFLVMLA